MERVNSTIFYTSSKNNSKNSKSSIVPSSVFRQELVTWEHTDNGIKRTTVIRSFNGKEQIDSYISEPIV